MTSLPETLEQVLRLSKADDCIVIGYAASEANVRWANTTSTTNGEVQGSRLAVISIRDGRVGSTMRSWFPPESLPEIVAASEAACEGRPKAEDEMPLIAAEPDAGWNDEPEATGVAALSALAPALGTVFEHARDAGIELFGYAEHGTSTTYLATSSGVRRRHVSPGGTVELTAKTPDFVRSAWTGLSATNFDDVSADAMFERVRKRLEWSKNTIELPAGRYEVILEPSATADMLVYMYWSSSARNADEGRSAFSKPGGGTRVGEKLFPDSVTLYSDPDEPGLETTPFLVTPSSSPFASVFDNGLDSTRTEWVSEGTLRKLIATRHWAQQTGIEPAPFIGNLVFPAEGPTVDEMIAQTQRGLLVTCLWYIRMVDPRTLLLTGLTRDGVFLIENGEVKGAVNNFRFNESPIDMLKRTVQIGRAEPTLAREFGESMSRMRVPPVRVEGFNMSSVSQAT